MTNYGRPLAAILLGVLLIASGEIYLSGMGVIALVGGLAILAERRRKGAAR
jgi:hypothetical protein